VTLAFRNSTHSSQLCLQVSAAMGSRLVEDSLAHARLVDMCAAVP
jgi:hypothetical protein